MQTNGRLFKRPSLFSFQTKECHVKLVDFHEDFNDHILGFKGYVSSLNNTNDQIRKATNILNNIKSAYGIILSEPISDDGSTFAKLAALAFSNGGFLFVHDSILTQDGYLVGQATYREPVMQSLAEVEIDLSLRNPASQKLVAKREKSLAILREKGFSCAESLPVKELDTLRPKEEIAGRLTALSMLFCHVVMPEEVLAENTIREFVDANDLEKHLTPDEVAIFTKPRRRAIEEYQNSIGWRTENMWPLAWLLGFEKEPEINARQLQQDDIQALLNFSPGPGDSMSAFLDYCELREAETAAELEDRFYCAHNAVRSAQLGRPAVPEDFDPVIHGGAVHERRHSLTWAFSPGVDWDETDLST